MNPPVQCLFKKERLLVLRQPGRSSVHVQRAEKEVRRLDFNLLHAVYFILTAYLFFATFSISFMSIIIIIISTLKLLQNVFMQRKQQQKAHFHF